MTDTAVEPVTAASSGREEPTALLSCRELDVSYGPVQVLFGVDFDVREGESVALLGTNGAGKSTLLRAISGLTPPTSGTVTFDGEDVTGSRPEDVARRGIVQMPGGRGIYPGLTVQENLKMATWLYRRDRDRVDDAIGEALSLFPVLGQRLGTAAGLLSGGQQQMLTLAQAFIGRPRLLMIDELSLGLAPLVVGELIEVVRGFRRRGMTIVIVEQSVNVALSLADRAVFMEKGEVRFSGATVDLLDRDDLLRSVFLEGGSSSAGARAPAAPAQARSRSGRVVLEALALTRRFGGVTAVDNVDLGVREGEIVGILGSNGAGKTTLLDLLSGFVLPDGGRVVMKGHDVSALGPDLRAVAGLGRSFQDAKMFPGLTVRENLAVACEPIVGSREPVAAALALPASLSSERAVVDRVERLIDLLGLQAFGDKYLRELSTGSRRIVELGALLARQPDVLLLDEPSAGIAQRESEALGPMLRRIRDATGCALVVVEHDVPLLCATCDRLVAMELGRVIAAGAPADVIADERVIASYLGGDPTAVHRSGAPVRRRRTRTRARPRG